MRCSDLMRRGPDVALGITISRLWILQRIRGRNSPKSLRASDRTSNSPASTSILMRFGGSPRPSEKKKSSGEIAATRIISPLILALDSPALPSGSKLLAAAQTSILLRSPILRSASPQFDAPCSAHSAVLPTKHSGDVQWTESDTQSQSARGVVAPGNL